MNSKIRNLIMSATALILCCAILFVTNYSISANLAGTENAQAEEYEVLSVSAQDGSDTDSSDSGKEEVVYVSMDASGSVTDINVVNIFNGAGDITDYGDYTTVKMMTTNDAIVIKDDKVTFTTTSQRVYYQGTLDANTALPWTISIKYYMDGVEYSASDIAGMSGSLKIELSVSENEAYKGECDFAGTYLLQAALTLDTDSAENIEAEGATIANVGSDKQLSYMVLPTQELEAEITADVTDFEMPSVEINGVPLSLALDIDSEELEDKINELLAGIEELDDGAGELSSGAEELSSGALELSSGAESLLSGAQALDDGITSLYTGMETLKSGLETLNANSDELTEGSEQILAALETIESSLSAINAQTDELSELSEASEQIQSGINSLYSGILSLQQNLSYSSFKTVMAANGLDLDALVEGNTEAVEAIEELLPILTTVENVLSNEKIAAYVQMLGIDVDVSELTQLANSLITLLNGNNAAIAGMEAYLDSVSSGVDTLADGALELSESYTEFNEAVSSLASGLTALLEQLYVLRSGVETLVDSYEALDSGLNEYTDGVAEIVAGYSQLISGIYTLSEGSSTLADGVSSLADGTAELYEGSVTLSDGSAELSDGTGELYDEINSAYDDIDEEFSDLLDAVTGDAEISSFVSEKNTDVSSVQFVITTEAIEIEEPETEEVTVEESSGFFTKLLDLFR